MNWLRKLPGHRQARPGLEWALWKRLPAVLAWGTALPLAVAAAVWWWAPARGDAADGNSLLLVYQLIGLVVLHWTLVFTVAIGCGIVMLMKGPGYVADPYPPPERDGRSEQP